MTKKIKVSHTFQNKKGVTKKVEFYMDSKLYNDIQTMPENEKNYWMEYYYHESCNDRYSERKAFRNREQFITADQEEQEDDEEQVLVSKKKLQQIADTTNDEKAMYDKLMVEDMFKLLDEDEKYCMTKVNMLGRSIISVANEMGIAESTVRKKIQSAIEKIKSNYKFQ